jgi:hypothetical protein
LAAWKKFTTCEKPNNPVPVIKMIVASRIIKAATDNEPQAIQFNVFIALNIALFIGIYFR